MLFQLIRMEAALISFGGIKVDYDGPTESFPQLSAVAGLIANALGLERTQADELQRLQDNLIVASRVTREGEPLEDFHTAKLGARDKGWTRWGVEKRSGGADTYDAPLVQRKSYIANAGYLVAVGIREPAGITVDEIGRALDFPMRTLFIGRKCCVPSCRLNAGTIEADTARAAIAKTIPEGSARAAWPVVSGGEEGADQVRLMSDRRNYNIDRHAGASRIAFGRLTKEN